MSKKHDTCREVSLREAASATARHSSLLLSHEQAVWPRPTSLTSLRLHFLLWNGASTFPLCSFVKRIKRANTRTVLRTGPTTQEALCKC